MATKKIKFDHTLVCKDCGSDEVKELVWVTLKNGDYVQGGMKISGNPGEFYCPNCKSNFPPVFKDDYIKTKDER